MGLVYLRYVNIDYQSSSITLDISEADDSTDLNTIDLPQDLRLDHGSFEEWLKKGEVLLILPSPEAWLIVLTQITDRSPPPIYAAAI